MLQFSLRFMWVEEIFIDKRARKKTTETITYEYFMKGKGQPLWREGEQQVMGMNCCQESCCGHGRVYFGFCKKMFQLKFPISIFAEVVACLLWHVEKPWYLHNSPSLPSLATVANVNNERSKRAAKQRYKIPVRHCFKISNSAIIKRRHKMTFTYKLISN